MIKMADEIDQLFNDIMSECENLQGFSYFSNSVCDRLEEYNRHVRKAIVSRKSFCDRAPLHSACETGHLKMVEYLISTCGADVEQRAYSRWRDQEGTALCIAAANGEIQIVECLLSHGSQVNALSGSGITPVQAACYWSDGAHEVVECLVKHGADIHQADASGRTCLMVAVGYVDMCKVLLKNGAVVDARDEMNYTALHHAIERKYLDTVKLLLDYGADVTLMRSVDNSDALQTACLAGFQPIFDYLVEHGSYSPGRLADANELMGSRCLFDDTQTTLKYWRKAIEIRSANAVDGNPLAKTPSMPTRDRYRNASEFTTLDELNAIALDSHALTIQNLLIHERILGDHDTGTFDALHRAGVAYAKMSRYQDCLVFWRRALEIGATHDSVSWEEVANVADGLFRALYNLHMRISLEVADPNRINEEQSHLFADVVAIFKLLTSGLVTAQSPSEKLLTMCSEGRYSYNTILICITHIIYLLIKTARSSEAEVEVRALVRHLVNQNLMSPRYHDTLLHLCVFGHNNPNSKYYRYNYDLNLFSDLEVTKLLLESEADVNARNVDGKTPLHIAISCPGKFSNQLVEQLLDHGAHLDTPDKSGSTPAHMLSAKPDNTVNLGNYMTLRCLAARAIVKNKIQYHNLPASVIQFLDLHRPL